MKKILTLITLLFLTIAVNAQITFRSSDDYKTYNGVAGDTLNSSFILAKSIFLGQLDFKYNYYIEFEADSAGDGTDITVRLRGSMNGIDYTNIGNAITWDVSTTDTTFIFDGLSSVVTTTQTIATHDEARRGTSILAAYIITASDSIIYTDTLNVAAQTTTYTDTVGVASHAVVTSQTIVTGYQWRYLQVYFLGGGANADMSIPTSGNPFRVRILKTE